MKSNLLTLMILIFVMGCEGMKVVRPGDQNENQGTLAVDLSGGQLKLVGTYTCRLESQGAKLSAVGKSEPEARKEVLARCHDRTLISFCKEENIRCQKN